MSLSMRADLEAQPGAARPSRPAWRKPSILVVDDVEDNRVVLSLMLAAAGYDAEPVADAAAAFDALKHRDFDLILMDVAMPGCDGLTATGIIRDMPGPARSIPIVAVTASVTVATQSACLEVGMQDYLSKPVTGATLTETFERWCGVA